MQFFKNRKVIVAAFTAMFSLMCILFFDGILALRLEGFGIKESNIGYIFAIGPFSYALICPFIGCFEKLIPRKYIIQIGLLLTIIALLFFGPSEMFHFPK